MAIPNNSRQEFLKTVLFQKAYGGENMLKKMILLFFSNIVAVMLFLLLLSIGTVFQNKPMSLKILEIILIVIIFPFYMAIVNNVLVNRTKSVSLNIFAVCIMILISALCVHASYLYWRASAGVFYNDPKTVPMMLELFIGSSASDIVLFVIVKAVYALINRYKH